MKARRRRSQAVAPNAIDQSDEGTGSPEKGEPVFLVVGRLRRPHGLNGELQMDVLTDFPERLVPGKQVFVGEEHLSFRFEAIRPHGKLLLISFEGLDDVDRVNKFTNTMVYVDAEGLPDLPEGEYYHHQLIGLSVVDVDSNDRLGRLEKILETGANDVYVVRRENGEELLLPVIDSVLVDIDLEKEEIKVHQQQWW